MHVIIMLGAEHLSESECSTQRRIPITVIGDCQDIPVDLLVEQTAMAQQEVMSGGWLV